MKIVHASFRKYKLIQVRAQVLDVDNSDKIADCTSACTYMQDIVLIDEDELEFSRKRNI